MTPIPHVPAVECSDALAPEPVVEVQPEVRALTSAIAAGDTDAFARFFHAWFDTLCADARRATGRDESFCHDVVQDAMMKVIRAMKPMNSEQDLRRWLRVVVRSCAFDHLRREMRRMHREAVSATRPRRPAEQTAETRQRLQWLERQLASIDGPSVELLLMRYRFGWTLRQIGSALGLAPGAVDGRLRRLVKVLRDRGGEQDHG